MGRFLKQTDSLSFKASESSGKTRGLEGQISQLRSNYETAQLENEKILKELKTLKENLDENASVNLKKIVQNAKQILKTLYANVAQAGSSFENDLERNQAVWKDTTAAVQNLINGVFPEMDGQNVIPSAYEAVNEFFREASQTEQLTESIRAEVEKALKAKTEAEVKAEAAEKAKAEAVKAAQTEAQAEVRKAQTEARTKVANAQAKVEAAEKAKAEAQTKVKKAQTETEKAQTEVANAQAKAEAIAIAKAEAEENLSQVVAKLERVEADANSAVAAAQAEAAKAKESMIQAEKGKGEAEKSISQTEQALEQIRSELEKAQTEVKQANDKVQSMVNLRIIQNSEIDQIKQELQVAKKNFANSKREAENANTRPKPLFKPKSMRPETSQTSQV